jgi:hypothetical protein
MTRLTKKELGFKIALFFLCRLNKILLIFKTTQDVEGLESINNSSLNFVFAFENILENLCYWMVLTATLVCLQNFM